MGILYIVLSYRKKYALARVSIPSLRLLSRRLLSLAHQHPPSPAVVIAAAATGGSGRARMIVAVPPPPLPSLQPPSSSTATIIVATKPFLLPPPPPPPNLVLFGRSTFSHTEESGHQEVKSKRVLTTVFKSFDFFPLPNILGEISRPRCWEIFPLFFFVLEAT